MNLSGMEMEMMTSLIPPGGAAEGKAFSGRGGNDTLEIAALPLANVAPVRFICIRLNFCWAFYIIKRGS